MQDRRVHDRAGGNAHSTGLQMQIHRPQDFFAKFVFFQQVPKLAHRGFVRLVHFRIAPAAPGFWSRQGHASRPRSCRW